MDKSRLLKITLIIFVSSLYLFFPLEVHSGNKFSPPPRPLIAPYISKHYIDDTDRDRINDSLDEKYRSARAARRALKKGKAAGPSVDDMVDVEFIFGDQIRQNHIDSFLASGGEITHIYKAVSYGWNGRIPLGKLKRIKAKMGSSLVLIDEIKRSELHMRLATQTGRVRPIWANGFAGSAGYDGDSTIGIAILDTGVDDSHTDMVGRQAYWNDYTTDGEVSAIDIQQHGSHVAGIALGTGASLGTGTTLYFTNSGDMSSLPSGYFYASVIDFPSVPTYWSSTATWLGGGTTTLYHAYTPKGGGGWYGPYSNSGSSGLVLNTSFTPSSANAYSNALLSNGGMSTYAVASSMTNYPVVGDGFNTLRGVAPGCLWIGAKVFLNSGGGYMSWVRAAIDDMVSKRQTYNIKVMNLSLGVVGSPGIDTSTRQKINTAANNGILPVISAGNDGPGSGSSTEVDDPGRAAMALTVGATNDINELTEYTSNGFASPGSTAGQEEDYKPDVIAPGGSDYYSNIMSVDTNDADGKNASFADVRSNDYYNIKGTSMSAPFAAGSAALVIDALQSTGNLTGGSSWDFFSSNDVLFVKMLLSATATETNANREAGTGYDPTLQRAANGPSGFPAGKDKYEGYGIINVDAAIEGGTVYYTIGATENLSLGGGDTSRRAWARRLSLTAGRTIDLSLNVPGSGDYDLYLYDMTPGSYGAPQILSSSTNAGTGTDESISYTPASGGEAIIVIKRITGSGSFTFDSHYSTYTLNVTKAGAGGGTVSSSPAGINCGSDCTEVYNYNTIVTLTPTADGSSAFAGWSGDTDCLDGTVTMSADLSCTATFDPVAYTLNINKTGTGSGTVTSSPVGIDCGTDCSEDYDSGTVVILTADENPGSIFVGWSGDADCSDGTVTMSSAITCTATFNLMTFTVSVTKSGSGDGTVSSTPGGIDCGPDCSEIYSYGTVVTLTAAEDGSSHFAGWSGGGCTGTGTCQITVTSDSSIDAAFQSCSDRLVRIDGASPVYYTTIQGAYDNAVSDDIIQSQSVTFTESPNLNRNINVTFDGGYDCGYSTKTGYSTISGSTTIIDGVVTIGDFIHD